MSLVKQISDRGAVLAWSPLRNAAPMLATATKEGGGGGFDDYGGELSVHSLDLSNSSLECPVISSVKTTSRFASLAWGAMTSKADKFPAGLLVAGMSDGIVNVWDANALITGRPETSILSKIERHKASVKSIQFNPHAGAQHLLAAGSTDGDISIINMDNPTSASIASPFGSGGQRLDSEVTSVAWNTNVAHILATATLSGTVVVWDLKENKPWCQLRDPQRSSVSEVVWNPTDGLFLVTACDDDSRPVLRVWDLRSSTNTPLCELVGHSKGIISVDWCPHDPNLLISSGKDAHTFIWDIQQGRTIGELPTPSAAGSKTAGGPLALGAAPTESASSVFGGGMPAASSVFSTVAPTGGAFDSTNSIFGGAVGGLGAGAGRRYCVRWSKTLPSLVASCSFDRKVSVHAVPAIGPQQAATSAASIIGHGPAIEATMKRAPRWLRRPVGAAFGFGGRLVSFRCPTAAVKTDVRTPAVDYAKTIQISVTNTELEFITKAVAFENQLSGVENTSLDATAVCDAKISEHLAFHDGNIAQQWTFIRAAYAEDSRTAVLQLLGFDRNNSVAELSKYLGVSQQQTQASPAPEETHASPPAHQNFGLGAYDGSQPLAAAEDVFGAPKAPEDDVLSQPSEVSESKQKPTHAEHNGHAEPQPMYAERRVPSPAEDALLKKALLIGDFASAVAICLKQDRLDDALVIAGSGDASLWASTQAEYFKRKAGTLMGNLGGVVTGDLHSVIRAYDLSQWTEALAVLCTYASADNFHTLCEELGDRLALEASDALAAIVTYIVAHATDKVAHLWVQEAQQRSASLGRAVALQEAVEKVHLFNRAVWIKTGSAPVVSAQIAEQLARHAAFIANEGYLATAAFYAARISDAPLSAGSVTDGHAMRDRLLRSFTHAEYAYPACQALFQAPFPYQVKPVDVAPVHYAHHDGHMAHQAHAQVAPAHHGTPTAAHMPAPHDPYAAQQQHAFASAHAATHAGTVHGGFPSSHAAPTHHATGHGFHGAPASSGFVAPTPAPAPHAFAPAATGGGFPGRAASHAPAPHPHAPAGPHIPTPSHGMPVAAPGPQHMMMQPTVTAPAAPPAPAAAPQPVAVPVPADFETQLGHILNIFQYVIANYPLSTTEKKQCDEGIRAVDTLRAKAHQGRISADTYGKLSQLGAAAAAWDLRTAVAVVAEINRSAPDAKEWIAGFRYAFTVAATKVKLS